MRPLSVLSFQGKCSYYLVQADGYNIQAENVPCSGAISEVRDTVLPVAATGHRGPRGRVISTGNVPRALRCDKTTL